LERQETELPSPSPAALAYPDAPQLAPTGVRR
jgi:hypothetical protein